MEIGRLQIQESRVIRNCQSAIFQSANLETNAIYSVKAAPRSSSRRQRPRVSEADADSSRRHSTRARRPRSSCMRPDGQREDRGVSAADSARADAEAAQPSGHDARAHHHADARAGGADCRRSEGLHRPHADQRLCRVRRRRHGPAGARLPQRRRRHRRHAGAAARSFPAAVREAGRPRVPRARRSRSHARHGLPARHPSRAPSHSIEAADAVFQRDDARTDREAVAGDAAEPGDDQPGAQSASGHGHRARDLSGVRRTSSRTCCSRC